MLKGGAGRAQGVCWSIIIVYVREWREGGREKGQLGWLHCSQPLRSANLLAQRIQQGRAQHNVGGQHLVGHQHVSGGRHIFICQPL